MMTSSLILAVLQFSALNEPMFTIPPVNSAPKVVPFTPEEPTTLALALVGIGLIAVYAGVKRIVRPRRESQQTSQRLPQSGATRIEPPNRSAA